MGIHHTMGTMNRRSITIQLDAALARQLAAVCRETGRSRSEVVRCQRLRRQALRVLSHPASQVASRCSTATNFR